MSNYQQPNAPFGSYDEGAGTFISCPECTPGNAGRAQLIGGGSFQWRCDKGHGHFIFFGLITPPPAFAPVRAEPLAENRFDLSELP